MCNNCRFVQMVEDSGAWFCPLLLQDVESWQDCNHWEPDEPTAAALAGCDAAMYELARTGVAPDDVDNLSDNVDMYLM